MSRCSWMSINSINLYKILLLTCKKNYSENDLIISLWKHTSGINCFRRKCDHLATVLICKFLNLRIKNILFQDCSTFSSHSQGCSLSLCRLKYFALLLPNLCDHCSLLCKQCSYSCATSRATPLWEAVSPLALNLKLIIDSSFPQLLMIKSMYFRIHTNVQMFKCVN